MSWRNIKLIFHREVNDQLRDRRTLFMVAVLPLLLYPALGIGMLQMTLLFSEQSRTVAILGIDDLPAPSLLSEDGMRIDARWFDVPSDAAKIVVVTEKTKEMTEKELDEWGLREQPPKIIEESNELVQKADEYRSLREQLDHADESKKQQLDKSLKELQIKLGEQFQSMPAEVLIIFPKGFAEQLKQVNQELASRNSDEQDVTRLRPIILYNKADEKSGIAYARVNDALEQWESAILSARLDEANLPGDLSNPLDLMRIDVAQNEQISANVWSKLFPALLIIMSVTGAFYPAIDLGAGEKERGTMETLLICPATRPEIVIGKFLTVMLFSICTALLNLCSMGITGTYMLSMGAGRQNLSALGNVAMPGVSQLFWVLLLAIPLSALFSALSLAFAIFAKSSKEGQYYLTPLLIVTMGLTVFCLSPAVELTSFFSFMPVMGPALLLKGLLLDTSGSNSLLIYAPAVLLTSFLYSFVALYFAIEQFKREDVLFREAERFELKLWLRHLLRDKGETPSFTEAAFCFVLTMLLQFFMMNYFGQALGSVEPGQAGIRMIQLLVIQQLVIIAFPAILMAIMLTSNPLKTLRLRIPHFDVLLIAFVLPIFVHPLTLKLQELLAGFFPQLPQHAIEALSAMKDPNIPFWLILLTFSVAPGLCEEVCFRGFILRGFQDSKKLWMPVILSGFLFGLMHMIPQQVFNASLLGIVLGLLAVGARSLLAPVVFHIMNNGLAVLYERNFFATSFSPGVSSFVKLEEGHIVYGPATLILSLIVVGVLLTLLVRIAQKRHAEDYPR